MRALTLSLTLILCASPSLAAPLQSQSGMVAADSAVASRVGAEILAEGGDAVDAAVATAFVLGVVQPFASGIGGGGFAVVHRASGESFALDFRERAPLTASRDMFLDPGGKVIPDASTRGPKAGGVPGEIAGLWALHQRHGRLPWAKVMQPAINLAVNGFTCGRILHTVISAHEAEIRQNPALASLFLNADGSLKKIGETITNTPLGETLKALSVGGADAFYRGELGALFVEAVAADGGLISLADLAGYEPRRRPLVNHEVMGHRFLSMPPPSSGGAVLVQVLRVLDSVGIHTLDWNSPAYVHRVVETLKHSFADRARLMGDPDFTSVPVGDMLGDDARLRITAGFNPKGVKPIETYGGKYSLPNDGGTAHFSVLDASGNAVALTTTVNTWLGSHYVAGKTGIILNNQMDDFVSRPGVPNAFGLVGRAANAIAPKKTPLSSMTPTIVLKSGRVKMVVGGSGGPRIITGTLQAILNVLVYNFDAQRAVEAPRFHHQWRPNVITVDPEFDRATVKALEELGHRLSDKARTSAVQVIIVDGDSATGASDPAKHGQPAGVSKEGKVIQ